jgi:enoyl-CoA hydratase/carnithine racemase
MPGRIGARKADGVGWLTFDHPERFNAIDLAMWRAIPEVMADFDADPDVRAICISGAGAKAFTTGADISEFEVHRDNAAQRASYNATADAARAVLHTTLKPTVAAIRGYCLGGGVALALDCDLRLAEAGAKFGVTIARLGAAYRPEDLRHLMEIVGPAAAREILLTGATFTADEAKALGLVSQVVAADTFDEHVAAFMARLAGNAPLSMAATKKTIAELLKPAGAQDLAACERLVDRCSASADAAEGRDAFMQKRKPVFRGV